MLIISIFLIYIIIFVLAVYYSEKGDRWKNVDPLDDELNTDKLTIEDSVKIDINGDDGEKK